MSRSTCSLLMLVLVSWLSSFGQNAPKTTFPRVVATFHRYGQTADLSPTTIYTPKNSGTFRVSVVMVLTVGNGNGNAGWNGQLEFNDGGGHNSGLYWQVFLVSQTPTTRSAEFPIRANPGAPIRFSASQAGDASGSKYNVWVVVEQLM